MIKRIYASRRVCIGCGVVVDGLALWPRCPHAGDGGEHTMVRELDEAQIPWGIRGDPEHAQNPFLRWRHRLHAWHLAQHEGWSDQAFIALVERLDRRIAARDGKGFTVTPLVEATTLATRLELGGRLFVKDETGNVAGSHKARHLMGELLAMEVLGIGHERALAIASCGNAALAAGVLAAASRRCLWVFVPPDASPAIVERLRELRVGGVTCERVEGEVGDPCVTRFRKVVRDGALAFSCQGTDNGLAIEGGETLGWEIVNQLDGTAPDRVFVQVGGGALGSAVGRALQQAVRTDTLAKMPRLHAVQTQACWPLARAYERLARRLDAVLGCGTGVGPDPLDGSADAVAFRERRSDRIAAAFFGEKVQKDLRLAAAARSELMWPWETTPSSVAHGILDDETYDWLALVRAMLQGGGFPIVVDEAALVRANELGVDATGIPADETGTAGLAGLMALSDVRAIAPGETSVVMFTGVRRPHVAAAVTDSDGGDEPPEVTAQAS